MKNTHLRTIAEGAIFIAIAMVLSYLEIPIGLSFGGFGGSLSLVMIPLVVFAVRRGTVWGLGVGLLFGALKFFFSNGAAINWESMLLDYFFAYMAVGLAGVMRGRRHGLVLGALIGCAARFVVHFISGITIYITLSGELFGTTINNSWLYSLLYNSTYMLPNTVLTVALCLVLTKPLSRFMDKAPVK
ncbi:MAG: energy-coupled thiamine transporter ThiT [Oscillospiraceae bacterium]|jgi:thiamine transporter|nr:energy-coupled thiamine transporter ThiT [Oscillospiraceae bacterium]